MAASGFAEQGHLRDEAAIAASGETPLEYMLRIARGRSRRVHKAETKWRKRLRHICAGFQVSSTSGDNEALRKADGHGDDDAAQPSQLGPNAPWRCADPLSPAPSI